MDTEGVSHSTVYFSGHVQGVGFRYTVLQLAKGFEVTGFAQNLSDGRVLVEAEGEPGELGEFARAIEERMAGYIRKVERRDDVRPGQFSGFTIR
jgi:acylphosphatase